MIDAVPSRRHHCATIVHMIDDGTLSGRDGIGKTTTV
jgi:hypothetical protein